MSVLRRILRWGVITIVFELLFLAGPTVAHAEEQLPPDASVGPCAPWVQVNNDAFDTGAGDFYSYTSEDAFEGVVFNGQLYLGMEADNGYGARLWRIREGTWVASGQADWEEVAEHNGEPFGNPQKAKDSAGVLYYQNDHIDSLAVFHDTLYASTANGSDTQQGMLVYSSPTGAPHSWTQVIEAGFGSPANVNFKDMQVFGDWLCGGTFNQVTGAQVWCTLDGNIWLRKSNGGFASSGDNPQVIAVWSGHVFEGALYFGAQKLPAGATDATESDRGVLYRATNLTAALPVWKAVYTSPEGGKRIDILGDLGGYLYIAHRSAAGIAIYGSPSGDAGTWIQMAPPGFGDPANTGTVVDGATVYNGALYVAAANATGGFEVWRTTGPGETWESVGVAGLNDPGNVYSELVSHHGYLYAWVGNYRQGQRVYRTSCSICQTQPIPHTGQVDFPAVGAVITLTLEYLDSMTVCAKPGALPEPALQSWVVAHTVAVTTDPAAGKFRGDITLWYETGEFVNPWVVFHSLQLKHSSADGWSACSAEAAFPAQGTFLTCNDVFAEVELGIAGQADVPLTVKHTATQGQSSWPIAIAVPAVLLTPLVYICARRKHLS